MMPRLYRSQFSPVVLAGLLFACMQSNPQQPAAIDTQSSQQDRVPLPPLREEFTSPAGRYVFVVAADDGWQSLKSSGELFHTEGNARTLLWKKSLPHPFRPRLVLVGNNGGVLLLDEWVIRRTDFAVMLVDRNNRMLVQQSFDDIQKLLDVPGSTIVEMSKYGSFLSAVPTLDVAGEFATLLAGGKRIVVNLADGRLSVVQ